MKVIAVDNFDLVQLGDDRQITVSGLSRLECEKIAEALNRFGGDYSDWYYKAVTDEYVLYKFEPMIPMLPCVCNWCGTWIESINDMLIILDFSPGYNPSTYYYHDKVCLEEQDAYFEEI